MNRLYTFVVSAVLTMGIASTSFSAVRPQQVSALGVQWLGKTEERLKQGVSLSFNASAYDCWGLSEENLGGSYSAVTGWYPKVSRGTVLDLRINAQGFKKIERVWINVGERAEGSKDRKDEKNGIWDRGGYRYRLCRRTEFPGEFSYLYDTSEAPLRPIPVQWLIEHRDDRDKYQVVIFTFTWTRGGLMTGSLEINIVRGPADFRRLRGAQILPFLDGFMPVDAVAGNNKHSTVIDGREASETISSSQIVGTGSDELPYRGTSNQGSGQPNTDIGVGMWSSPDEPRFANATTLGDDELKLVAQGKITDQKIDISPDMWNVIYVLSTQPFEAKLVKDGHPDFQLKVEKRPDGINWVRTWGRTGIAGATLVVTQNGQTISYPIRRK